MKRFKFPLETLLQVKMIEEGKEKEKFARSIIEVNHVKSDIEEVDSQTDEVYTSKGDMDFNKVRANANRMMLLRREKRELEEDLIEKVELQKKALISYQKSIIEMESVKKLKENSLKAYKKEREKYLANELDELVIQNFGKTKVSL